MGAVMLFEGRSYPVGTFPVVRFSQPSDEHGFPYTLDATPGIRLVSPDGTSVGPYAAALDGSGRWFVNFADPGLGLLPDPVAGDWGAVLSYVPTGTGGSIGIAHGGFVLDPAAPATVLSAINAGNAAAIAAIAGVSTKVDTANAVLARLDRLAHTRQEYSTDRTRLNVYTAPPFVHLYGHFPLTYNDAGILVTRGQFVVGS